MCSGEGDNGSLCSHGGVSDVREHTYLLARQCGRLKNGMQGGPVTPTRSPHSRYVMSGPAHLTPSLLRYALEHFNTPLPPWEKFLENENNLQKFLDLPGPWLSPR